jgi:hypothetical protein
MRRITSVAAAAALLSSLVFAGGVAAFPEGAEGPPAGGCPAGGWWELGTYTPGHGGEAIDYNGDGHLCRLDTPDGAFLLVDNVVR